MKSRLIANVVAIIIILIFVSTLVALAATSSEVYIPSETLTLENKQEVEFMMNKSLAERGYAEDLATAARQLGYEDSHPIIQTAKKEWDKANKSYNSYKEEYDTIVQKENDIWTKRQKEYPIATYIWKHLKNMGYNDYVCAGIMGNIMVEVGGQTLQLDHMARGAYFGICQWSKGYKEVWGANLDRQCVFLTNTIDYELNTYGFCYKQGFKYNNFIALTDEKQAALAFAKCYERCSSKSYSLRQKCATKALEYFTK